MSGESGPPCMFFGSLSLAVGGLSEIFGIYVRVRNIGDFGDFRFQISGLHQQPKRRPRTAGDRVNYSLTPPTDHRSTPHDQDLSRQIYSWPV